MKDEILKAGLKCELCTHCFPLF